MGSPAVAAALALSGSLVLSSAACRRARTTPAPVSRARANPAAAGWPGPDSEEAVPPAPGAQGSFWEDRGDRHHCGVDLHAPYGSEVLAVEAGDVLETGVFTSPNKVPYWNTTYFVLVRARRDGTIARYAEVERVAVATGAVVRAGQVVAHVGQVLSPERIDASSPPYIQALKAGGRLSMLHLELYAATATPDEIRQHLGNVPTNEGRPQRLLDPTAWLAAVSRRDPRAAARVP